MRVALCPVQSRLADAGRLETLDLEAWIAWDPTIVRAGLRIIGRQVISRSGPIDLLAIDQSGDLVVIELKRDKLPGMCLRKPSITRLMSRHGRLRRSARSVPNTQVKASKIYLRAPSRTSIWKTSMSTSVSASYLWDLRPETSLERLIEWLSDNYGVSVNAVILKYVKTATGSG